jgi:hypothetical protein
VIPLSDKAFMVFWRCRHTSSITPLLQFGDTYAAWDHFLLPSMGIFDKLVTKVPKQS